MVAVQVPVVLATSAADYITAFGTATLHLEYGTATAFAALGTSTVALTSGTERYEFELPSVTTAHYYRWRVGNAAASTATDYSPVFQFPLAYATMEELVSGMDLPDESRYDDLDRLLRDATDFISTYVTGGRRFFRDPVGSGTTTLSLDVRWRGQRKLSLARGRNLDIISLSSVGIAGYTGASYDTVASGSTGYYLDPDYVTGKPYSDVVLSDQAGTYAYFPPGYRTVQLVGAFGWSSIPDLVRRATVDLARHWYHRQPGEADPVGVGAFGQPVFGPGTPKTVRDLHNSEYAWHGWTG
jgi:hypothetical protein